MGIQQDLFNSEKFMYKWWLKIRWFLTMVLFTIGILQVAKIDEQTYPISIFVAAFIGINMLNLLYYMQIIKTNNILKAFQVFLDAIFATLIVHLTGGMGSPFVWIYLLAIITASLLIEQNGGFLAAMIGSLCLLFLVLLYNLAWLSPIGNMSYKDDIASQTIFLISYTGLFSGMAAIISCISDLVRHETTSSSDSRTHLKMLEDRLEERDEQFFLLKRKNNDYVEALKLAAQISHLDHDINNPLTIFSLSGRRIKNASEKYNDEKLKKTSDQIYDGVEAIKKHLLKIEDLKHLKIVQEFRETSETE